jgi:hypothetical protein
MRSLYAEPSMTAPETASMKMPSIVKFAVWLTFLNTWVMFEEFIVDREGLWRYMPFYRVGKFCPWDVAAMVIFGFIVWRSLGDRKTA